METPNKIPPHCTIHSKMLTDIHTAVCGNDDIGVEGLVKDVKELKDWRRRLDIRVATIAGGVSVAAFIIKHIWNN